MIVTDIKTLIADDGYAASFQSLGQYRSALLKAPTPAAQGAGQEAVAWRDAIEAAVQVMSHVEAGDDVFVGQASEAIAGLTAILRAPSIPPTFEQARDALCDALGAYPPKHNAAPVNGGELHPDHVLVSKELLLKAAQAINWHLEPGSPDEHEAVFKHLVDIACTADAPQVGGDTAKLVSDIKDAIDALSGGCIYPDLVNAIDQLAALSSPAKEQK